MVRFFSKFHGLGPAFFMVCLVAVCALSSPVCGHASKNHSKRSGGEVCESGQRTLARHLFREGARHSMQGDYDAAAEYYRRAYEADTAYSEAAFEYGMRRAGMQTDTLATAAERERSLGMMRGFTDKYPGDFFNIYQYAQVAQQMGKDDEALRVLEQLVAVRPDVTEVLPVLGDLYLDMHRFDDAYAMVEKFERAEGEDIKLSLRKAAIRIAQGDTVAAIGEARRMISKYPGNPQYWVMKGQLEQYLQMPDSALASWKRAGELSGPEGGGPVKMQLAEYYRNEGDQENYDKYVYEALMSDDLPFEVKHDLLAYYLQRLVANNEEHERGDRLFAVLLKQYPHEPALLGLSSRYNSSKGDFAAAMQDLGYAMSLDPGNLDFREQSVMIPIMSGDYAGSMAALEDAERQLPELTARMYSLGATAATLMEDDVRAMKILERGMHKFFPGIKLDEPIDMKALRSVLTYDNVGDLITFYQQAGDVRYKQGESAKAFRNYDNSLELGPDNPLTLNNYAYFIVEKGGDISAEDLEKADKMSARAVSLASDNFTYLDTRAWVLYCKGEYEEARKVIEEALQLAREEKTEEREMTDIYEHYGDILNKLEDMEGAREYWKKAHAADPGNERLKKKATSRK